MKKNGVVLIGPYPPPYGGVSAYIESLHKSPLDQEFGVQVFNTYTPGGISSTMKKSLSLCRYLIRNRKELGILHIHGGSRSAFWKYLPVFFLNIFLRRNIIYHIHSQTGFTKFLEGSAVSRFFFNLFLKRQHIIVLSTVFKKFLEDRFGYRNIHYVHTSVNIKEEEMKENPGLFKEIFSEGQREKKKILFFGLVTKRKGVQDLVKVIPELVEKHPEALFIIAGTSGDFTAELDEFVASFGKPDNLLYLKNVSNEVKVELFRCSDIYTLPTYSEGLPMAIMDAMAFGMPMVTTPVGAIPEVIIEGENGFLGEPGDHQKLAENISMLLGDEALCRKIRENNMKKARGEFTPDKLIAKMSQIYHTVLSGK